MGYVIAAIVLAILVGIGIAYSRGRSSGKQSSDLKVEKAGRKQREHFDALSGDWDAGGGLAGRMHDDIDDDSTPS